jgi:protein-tyrosine phosphatase
MPTSTAEAHVHRLSMLNKLLDKNVALTLAEARDRLRLTYMLEKDNLSPINIEEDNLFLGRYRATLDPLLLSTFGITHIVKCGRGYPRDEAAHARFGYLHIKANDTTEERLAPYFPQACDFIETALKSGGKLLIHCAAGISRSSTILLAYLMRSRRWTLKTAFDFVRDKRNIIRPNPTFAAELLDWEELVLGVRVTKSSIARNVQAMPAKKMDWRQAMGVMFAEPRKGVPVSRDTGMAHLVWDEFKKAFPPPLGEDGVFHADKDVLHDILSEGHARVRAAASKKSATVETLIVELITLQLILVMGSKYVSHVLPAHFLDAVSAAVEGTDGE